MATRRKATSASSSSPSKRTRSTRRDATSASRENGRRTEPETINVAADTPTETKSSTEFDEDRFVGEPVPAEEAKDRWPHRYQMEEENQAASIRKGGSKKEEDDEDVIIQARCHYTHAIVDDNVHYDLLNDAYVKAEDGQDPYICRLTEMFESIDGTPYVTCQWYYRAKDTDIKENWEMIDKKRVFLSQVKNDNPLSCLIKKLTIVKVKLGDEKPQIDYDYYYDMMYFLPYSSFIKVQDEDDVNTEVLPNNKSSLLLLDMYAGCGGMSTGLSIGCNLSGSNLVTKWAVDLNEFACQSLKKNHPETEVRNEAAENFLALLKEWRRLCATFGLISDSEVKKYTKLLSVDEDGKHSDFLSEEDEEQKSDILTENEDNSVNDVKKDNDPAVTRGSKVYEVEKVLDILFGVPNKNAKNGLHLKVRWKGYGPAEDSWEPLDGLSNCATSIKAFVFKGYKSKILPLQGDVDVLCGGPPCQGISGFNRFRNTKNPLDDPKNSQLIVFMDVVDYLKPRYVLMENVVDILKFKDGYLGGYALGRLIGMNYQARTGIMAAGCYGLPQFRMRVFLWGAHNSEKLPQYPLPTHDVVTRGGAPVKAEKNLVAYDEGHKVELKKLLLLGDAISDLPQVTNFDKDDEMPYSRDPETDFQKHIRSKKNALDGLQDILYDHRALPLSNDDYARVQQVPKRKGANFRDLPGVCVGDDNKVYFDPSMEQVMLPSGKPLVPSYAMSFEDGRSPKPFGRLWWDETVPTIVTRAQPHNQRILHPEQDRVLSIRENARLQGFPDYYQLCGDVKQRYIQIGNAVAVPVGTALGYALGLALQGTATSDPVLTLPDNFPHIETP